jgi:HK97 family phage prohead protease
MHHSPPRPKGSRPMAVVPGTGVFEGFAARCNRADAAGDIILPGAFTHSLQRRGVAGVRMLFQHDPSEPIGTWIEMVESGDGLFVRGRLNRNVQRGREVLALLEQKGLDGLSIGFRTVAASRDKLTGLRKLHRVDLWEISLVTFPMQEGARVTRVKARAEAEWATIFKPSTKE